ncbi:MAG: hypothetical protein ACI9BD_001315 [Candidatus Marinamargulisbacteria bacterium]
MKKYTVYEIEKLTDGKLSKYKLNRAIAEGSLAAEKVEGKRRGRGIPKYYVYESELQGFLKKIGDERKKKIDLPGDTAEPQHSTTELKKIVDTLVLQKNEMLDKQTLQIEDLKERVRLLETEKSELLPILSEQESKRQADLDKSDKRRDLVMELANISLFSVGKRKNILSQLNQLS